MKLKTKSITWTVALAAALSLVGVRPCAAQVAANALNLPSGYDEGAALAVNASGQVAGFVGNAATGAQNACVWSNAMPAVLPDLTLADGTVCGEGQPNAINASGVVVGYTVLAFSGNYYYRATRWTPNGDGTYTATDLGVLAGDTESQATAINDEDQILCESDNGTTTTSATSTTWFLYGDSTGLTDGNGHPIYAGGVSYFVTSGLLASDGRVAGRVDLGPDASGHELYQAVLWHSGTVTDLTDGGPDDAVNAISPNGVVAGYSDADGFFIYDSNTGNTTSVDSTPWTSDDGSISYVPYGIWSVNDQGQAVVGVLASDSIADTGSILPYVWQSGDLTQIPIDSLLPTGSRLYEGSGVINNNGQVAGVLTIVANGALTAVGFGWSASTGMEELVPVSYTDAVLPVALNDSGLAVGLSGTAPVGPSTYLPATWSLSGQVNQPPVLDVSAAPTTGVVGTPVTFTATATDPDGDALTFSLGANAPAGASIDPQSGAFTWTPTAAGTFTFDVTVTDAGGLSDTKSVTIDVSALGLVDTTATSPSLHSPNITVTVTITNPSTTDTDYNVTVTSANLGGIDSNSSLPLLYGAIKPGTSKQCTLHFKNVPSGEQTLTITGTSSLGAFFTTQKVTVP